MWRATHPSPTNLSLRGKIAVVVGGGRGIGRATALTLASAGATAYVVARTAADLQATVAGIQASGGQAAARPLDITRSDQVQALADELRAAHGRVDILVNSAGTSFIGSLAETTEAEWDRVLDTNLKGPFLCIRAMLDLLRASGSAWVINISSKVGLTGHAQVSAYAAAKSGLVAFGRSLAQELGAQGVRVLTLCPGPVDTPMRWAATPDLDPDLTIPPDTIAQTILFLVSLNGHTTLGSEIVLEALGYRESAVPLARQKPEAPVAPATGA
jgi:NAD(P)-dependent dehydrogenase (short-subunit alcohol dehydrogenase family)